LQKNARAAPLAGEGFRKPRLRTGVAESSFEDPDGIIIELIQLPSFRRHKRAHKAPAGIKVCYS